MSNCLFCKIVTGAIPCDEVYQDDDFLAFRDINPQAPTHILLIPKKHIAALNEIQDGDADLLGRLTLVARNICHEQGLDAAGYRWVVNCGDDGCQTVPHLHFHLLGGRSLGWPPG